MLQPALLYSRLQLYSRVSVLQDTTLHCAVHCGAHCSTVLYTVQYTAVLYSGWGGRRCQGLMSWANKGNDRCTAALHHCSMVVLHCCTTVLLKYYTVELQYYTSVLLLHCCPAALLHYLTTALLRCTVAVRSAVLQHAFFKSIVFGQRLYPRSI